MEEAVQQRNASDQFTNDRLTVGLDPQVPQDDGAPLVESELSEPDDM